MFSGFVDVKTGSEHVRQIIADYLNEVIDMGVAGFLLDASKHIWPEDLAAIYAKVNELSTEFFPPGTDPFVFNEVLSL